ncbi:hypothetical protein HanRHA438_Chr03g0139281 [Helianthus annuus]|nr:hypothetical protein HanRHA438_Chr03g0139281 [Helianthus annuus]
MSLIHTQCESSLKSTSKTPKSLPSKITGGGGGLSMNTVSDDGEIETATQVCDRRRRNSAWIGDDETVPRSETTGGCLLLYTPV